MGRTDGHVVRKATEDTFGTDNWIQSLDDLKVAASVRALDQSNGYAADTTWHLLPFRLIRRISAVAA
jgi:hypothetical protein